MTPERALAFDRLREAMKGLAAAVRLLTKRLRRLIEMARNAVALPELNTEMIFNLVTWAEHDKNVEEGVERYDLSRWAGWGHWNQGSWADRDLNRTLDGDGIDELEMKAAVDSLRTTYGDWLGVKPNVCGTAFCMAGQAVVQNDGYRLLYDTGGFQADNCVAIEPTGEVDRKGRAVMRDVPNVQPRAIWRVAQEQLGLTYDEQSHMFGGDNTIEYLKGLVNWFAEERHLPPIFPGHDPVAVSFDDWEGNPNYTGEEWDEDE